MNELKTITINNTDISVKEYRGKRVVTLKEIDQCHGRPDGTARKRFNDNKAHFIEGEDFFKASYNEIIESPLGGRSIFDIPNETEGYRGIDYSGFIYIVQDLNNGYWKIGRTSTKKTVEKRLNLSRTYNLENYQYFECVDTLRADKIIQDKLKPYKIKNSWYDCDINLIIKEVKGAISKVSATHEPRKKHKGGFRGDVTLITESGYLMLVKSFTDDLAWDVQRQLVNSYFKVEKSKADDTLKIQIQQERSRAMLLNAQYRMLKLLIGKPELQKLSPVAVESLGIKATESIINANLGDYLPEVEKTYSATEVGNAFGITAAKVGRIANANGLKTDEYGIVVMDKSRYSPKEVPNFRYNERGKAKIKELLEKLKK